MFRSLLQTLHISTIVTLVQTTIFGVRVFCEDDGDDGDDGVVVNFNGHISVVYPL
jgi:hypothetical protein